MFSRPYKPFAKLINKAALQTALKFFLRKHFVNSKSRRIFASSPNKKRGGDK